MTQPRAFWFHYNKPESKIRGYSVLTVHYKGMCHMVVDIKCGVPISTRHRKTQPRCVMAGKGIVTIKNGVAIISPKC